MRNKNYSLIYWNNGFVGSNTTHRMSRGVTTNFDFWYVPTATGTNIQVKAVVNGTSTEGFAFNDTEIKLVNVTQTRDLTIDFVPVDGPNELQNTIDESVLFINKTYPLADEGVLDSTTSILVNTSFLNQSSFIFDIELLLAVRTASLLSGHFTERTVGVVPNGWFLNNLNDSETVGFALFATTPTGSRILFRSVVIEEDYRSLAAHELGHTYGLCDEYNATFWEDQNTFLLGDNLCPNGDVNNDEILDNNCLVGLGCSGTTIGLLVPWSPIDGEDLIFNFMGNAQFQSDRWVAIDTYNYLLEEFSHSTPIQASSRLLVSGFYDKNNDNVEFTNFYQLEEGLAENQSEFISGNFAIESLGQSDNILSNFTFNLPFLLLRAGGEPIEINVTPFSFVIPLDDNVSSIIFMNNTILEQRNRTANIPNVTLNFPNGSEFFHNKIINISWNASDADGDILNYAVLLSTDNGGNFTTLTFDHNYTSFTIDSSNLPDCTLCRIKILATDSFNTNSSISETFAMDNNLNISEFKVVYQNSTEKVFRFVINNTLTSTLSNVSWSLDTGNGIKSSQFDFPQLISGEESFVYIHHNYTASGSFNVTATARSDIFTEVESINIII